MSGRKIVVGVGTGLLGAAASLLIGLLSVPGGALAFVGGMYVMARGFWPSV
ncbi:MAG: hypothetical protein OXF61_04740 [Acidimicrobiaceae bacterium]|nr:hypothetical protein [Acidimicrobiaceae bacterium]